MEAPNQFQLELAIEGYLQQLQSGGNYSPEDIMELKNHLLENVVELKQKQLSGEESFMIAKKRLGKEDELNVEYKKVNGNVFYNRDLFVMVLGICTYLLFAFLYTISQNVLKYLAIYQGKNALGLGIVNYILQIAIVGSFIYLVFNSRKFLSKVSRIFSKSPANFTALLIILLVALYMVDFYFQRSGNNHLPGKIITERYYQFTIDNTIFDVVRILLGSILLIAFFAAFVTSYTKVKILDTIVNKTGYIALFCFGFFWDGFASSARMLIKFTGNDIFISTLGFGAIWFIGMLIFNIHLKEKVLIRNLVFISFGFVMELAAGIWINPHLNNGLPVSAYFIALVIGGGLGYLLANLIKGRRVLAKST